MSDHLDDRPDEHGLPAWVGRALRAPVPTAAARKARLMTLVRAAAAPAAHVGPTRLGWRARRGLAPFAGLAAAAAFAGVTVLGATRASHPAHAPGAGTLHGTLRDTLHDTLHDTLLATAGAAVPVRAVLADSLGDALLRDTLRLVRFVLVAPTATRLALVGDFNAWNARATPMAAAAESTGVWTATVPLGAGTHRYAFVLDDTGRVADPAAPGARDSAGRAFSSVVVPGVRN